MPGSSAPRLLLGLCLITAGPLAAWPQGVLDEIKGTHVSDALGSAIASGDVNNDGIADCLVGIPNGQTAGGSTGRVDVYSGADGSFLFSLDGTVGFSAFGLSVAYAGDTNNDGYGDILVGAPFHQETGELQNGRAFLFSGFDGSLRFQWGGPGFQDSMGFAVAGVGDVDGDGRADVGVGAPGFDGSFADTGAAFVYSGATGQVLHSLPGASAGDGLGSSLAGLGDLQNDGFADFAVGARGRDMGFVDAGSVRVYSGSTGGLLYEVFGKADGHTLGSSLAALGDVDLDGRQDWISGGPQDDRAGNNAGSVLVASGVNGAELFDLLGSAPFERAGESVASAGDLDADGWADFMVGSSEDATFGNAAGKVTTYAGIDGSVICTLFGEVPGARFGKSVAGIDDVNGDAIADLALAAPNENTTIPGAGVLRMVAGCRLQGTSYCAQTAPNSTGMVGALVASGSIDVTHNQLSLIGRDLPAGEFGYFLVGTQAGFVMTPGGSQGNLCLGGALGRFNRVDQIRQVNAAGQFRLQLDLTALPYPGGQAVMAGETWFFQGWYRDTHPNQTSNFTHGLAVVFP